MVYYNNSFIVYASIIILIFFRCQEVLLEEGMITGPNIANNAALRENVFMMTICIELRIPLFLVGKPGSSKSLAKSIVANSMHGKASSRELMKNFKEVYIIHMHTLNNIYYIVYK